MRDSDPLVNAWPKDFFEKHCGFLEEEFEEPADTPPEALETSGPQQV